MIATKVLLGAVGRRRDDRPARVTLVPAQRRDPLPQEDLAALIADPLGGYLPMPGPRLG